MPYRMLSIFTLCVVAGPLGAATVTVNSAGSGNTDDDAVTLSEALEIVNGTIERALTAGEEGQVEGALGTDDRVHFNIPGDGPHEIPANTDDGFLTITASNVIIDGYTQPGASPNTGGILEGNNAVLQIVVDARGGEIIPFEPDGAEGDTIRVLGNNVTIQGLSILTTMSTVGGGPNFGVNWRDGATGGQFSGNWLGLHPDGATVAGGEIGVGACSTGGSQVFGTNGDGANDVGEFNVIVGFNVNTIVEGSPDVTIAGNYIGILPDGLSPLPQAAQDLIGEGDAVEGGGLDGLTFGTNGDGVSDEHERNIVGSMKDEAIQFFFGSNPGVRISGNFFGVGIDGATPQPMNEFFDLGGTSLVAGLIGSNFDGTSDDLEGNILANFSGTVFQYPENSLVAVRGNSMFNNTGDVFGDLERSFHASVLNRNMDIAPQLESVGLTVKGEIPVALETNVDPVVIDVYAADPASVANAGAGPTPQAQGVRYIGSFEDDGALDADDTVGIFSFDLSNADLRQGEWLVVTDNVSGNGFGQEGIETSPFSNALPLGVGPFLRGDCQQDGVVDITDGVFVLNFGFQGTASPACLAACDFNGDGAFNITNAIYLFNFLFQGGPAPARPRGAADFSAAANDIASGCESPQT